MNSSLRKILGIVAFAIGVAVVSRVFVLGKWSGQGVGITLHVFGMEIPGLVLLLIAACLVVISFAVLFSDPAEPQAGEVERQASRRGGRRAMRKLKFSVNGLLRLKPFDEEPEARRASLIYVSSLAWSLIVVLSGVLTLSALVMVILNHPRAIQVFALAVGVSAVVAGFEWHAGLRARPLNQLIGTVVISLILLVVM